MKWDLWFPSVMSRCICEGLSTDDLAREFGLTSCEKEPDHSKVYDLFNPLKFYKNHPMFMQVPFESLLPLARRLNTSVDFLIGSTSLTRLATLKSLCQYMIYYNAKFHKGELDPGYQLVAAYAKLELYARGLGQPDIYMKI